jgi:hypothetical protein
MPPLIVSQGDLVTTRDQTARLATSRANSDVSSGAPVLRALAQLSETMNVLVGEGELGHARAVHEAIGKLLTSSNEPLEARRTNVSPLSANR